MREAPLKNRPRLRRGILIAMYVLPVAWATYYALSDTQHVWRAVLWAAASEAGLLIAEAYIRLGVDQIRDFLRSFALLIQMLAFIAVSIAVGDAKASLQFYSVAAQLIAVLLLALVFQGAAFDLRRTSLDDLGSLVVTLGSVIVGEATALSSVFHGKPGGAGIVCGAIAAVLAGIVVHALIGRDEPAGATTGVGLSGPAGSGPAESVEHGPQEGDCPEQPAHSGSAAIPPAAAAG
jgi:hypothetical protein